MYHLKMNHFQSCLMTFTFASSVVVSTAAAPLGLIGSAPSAAGDAAAIDLQDNIVYLCDWDNNSHAGVLQTFDVSNPAAPVSLASVSTPGGEIGALAVSGNYAYLANDELGISVYDVSDPSAPNFVFQRNDGGDAHAVTLASVGTSTVPYAFVGHIGAQLHIYDLTSSPSLPAPIVYNSPDGSTRDVYDTRIQGNHAYVLMGPGTGSIRLEILDVSGLPPTPVRIGNLALPTTLYGAWGDLRVSGNYVFYAGSGHSDHVGGLRVIDVSDPASPFVAASLDIPDIGQMDWIGAGLDLSDNRVYMVGRTGFHVIDVSNPIAPNEVAVYPLPASFLPGEAGSVIIRNDLAYTAVYGQRYVGHGGLAIYRIRESVLSVRIDIKPGSTENCINPNDYGVIPVVLYGSAEINVGDLDIASLQLQYLIVKVAGRHYLASYSDVDEDGFTDVVLHFEDSNTWVTPESGFAKLTGKLLTGTAVEGSDRICIVP